MPTLTTVAFNITSQRESLELVSSTDLFRRSSIRRSQPIGAQTLAIENASPSGEHVEGDYGKATTLMPNQLNDVRCDNQPGAAFIAQDNKVMELRELI